MHFNLEAVTQKTNLLKTGNNAIPIFILDSVQVWFLDGLQ